MKYASALQGLEWRREKKKKSGGRGRKPKATSSLVRLQQDKPDEDGVREFGEMVRQWVALRDVDRSCYP
jgi:hypothetical protein